MRRPPVRLVTVRPGRTWYRPGSTATVELGLMADHATSMSATVELLDLHRVVRRATSGFEVPSGRSTHRVPVDLPRAVRHGYGIRASVTPVAGGTPSTSSSAVEVLDGWWESPRHAALTEFRTPERTAAAATGLRDWHVTVAQAYDWMYRHYRYTPPSGEAIFLDALGREVSHDAVRAGIRAARDVGIATLAYGSVYGAEREYVDEHPTERVFDDAGEPLSLGGTFYINDLRPGRPWRQRLLSEYDRAMRDFGFAGIHMDTYGPPHHAVSHGGEPISFAEEYPGLIVDGARTVAAAAEGGNVLFNCVEGFALDRVAEAPVAALYLELWPPDVAYSDIVRWIERARAVAEGRAVVIAAYISSLRTLEHDRDGRRGAVEAALLLTTLITAAGGYHHVLAERDRVLVEGYYPEARPLRAREREELRAAWVFGARYLHLLSDPGQCPEPPQSSDVTLVDAAGAPIATSSDPMAGTVWVRATRLPDGTRVVQLVDLLDQHDGAWDAPRQASPRRSGWRLRWGHDDDASIAMSPWTAGGDAQPLRRSARGALRLPVFRRWLVLVRPADRALVPSPMRPRLMPQSGVRG